MTWTDMDDGLHTILFVGDHCPKCKGVKRQFTIFHDRHPGIRAKVMEATEDPKLSSRCMVESVPSIRMVTVEGGKITQVQSPFTYQHNGREPATEEYVGKLKGMLG